MTYRTGSHQVGDKVFIYRLPLSWEPVPATVVSFFPPDVPREEIKGYVLEVHDPDPYIGGRRERYNHDLLPNEHHAREMALRHKRRQMEADIHRLEDRVHVISRQLAHWYDKK